MILVDSGHDRGVAVVMGARCAGVAKLADARKVHRPAWECGANWRQNWRQTQASNPPCAMKECKSFGVAVDNPAIQSLVERSCQSVIGK